MAASPNLKSVPSGAGGVNAGGGIGDRGLQNCPPLRSDRGPLLRNMLCAEFLASETVAGGQAPRPGSNLFPQRRHVIRILPLPMKPVVQRHPRFSAWT